jgi:hypothetical protein
MLPAVFENIDRQWSAFCTDRSSLDERVDRTRFECPPTCYDDQSPNTRAILRLHVNRSPVELYAAPLTEAEAGGADVLVGLLSDEEGGGDVYISATEDRGIPIRLEAGVPRRVLDRGFICLRPVNKKQWNRRGTHVTGVFGMLAPSNYHELYTTLGYETSIVEGDKEGQ